MRRYLPVLVFTLFDISGVAALELPHHKPGLWEQKVITNHGVSDVIQFCTDGEWEAQTMQMLQQSGSMEHCDISLDKTGEGTFVSDGTCTNEGITVKSHSEIKGDFNSAYTVTSTISTEGMPTLRDMLPDNLPEETRAEILKNSPSTNSSSTTSQMTREARWLGPCKPDQKPGDVILSNGRKINASEFPGNIGEPEPLALPR